MGAGNAGTGGNSNQVSGYEREITRQRRQQSNAINTDQKVGSYGDTKTGRTFGGEYSKENQNPNDNIQNEKKSKSNTNTNNGGGGNDKPVIVKKTIGGNKIQTTEAKVEKAKALTADEILLRNKKRGRSNSIMTSSKGVTKTSSDYSLGEATLLGRV